MLKVEMKEEHLKYITAILGSLSEYDAITLLMDRKNFIVDKTEKEELGKLITIHENNNDYNLKVYEMLNNFIK